MSDREIIKDNTNVLYKDERFLNVLNKDKKRHYISYKIEAITKAVFYITGNIKKDSVVINDLEKSATRAMTDIMSFIFNRHNTPANIAIESVVYVRGCLGCAEANGAVSKMNADLIRQAYEDIALLLSEYLPDENTVADAVQKDMPAIKDIAQTVGSAKQAHRTYSSAPKGQKKQIVERGKNGQKKTERRNKILTFLKDNTDAGIKDIKNEFNGVSEKTIQRELTSLVSAGLLGKKGERRWSTYFII